MASGLPSFRRSTTTTQAIKIQINATDRSVIPAATLTEDQVRRICATVITKINITMTTLIGALTVYLVFISAVKDLICATILPQQYDQRLRRFKVAPDAVQNASNKTLPTFYVTPIPATSNYNSIHNNYYRPSATLYQLPPQYAYAATSEIAKYRNEGNFYQPPQLEQQTNANLGEAFKRKEDYNVAMSQPQLALYENKVLHVEPPPTSSPVYYALEEYRPRRYTRKQKRNTRNLKHAKSLPLPTSIAQSEDQGNDQADAVQDQESPTTAAKTQTRHYHDIYMRYTGPQRRDFGHVEQRPELFEQRFESLDKGNRYKGEVKWADASGGYGEHRWNMAQGKLL